MLLPNRNSLAEMVDALSRYPAQVAGNAVGLFLADPFLHLPAQLARLSEAGVTWVANLPSVEQQDTEFSQQLTDVGLDGQLERARLAELQEAGFGLIAVVADAQSAGAAAALDPAALLVMPRVGDFAAGFPSFHQRGAAAGAAAAAARDAGWSGPLWGLAEAGEAEHETLWPDVLDGVVCRPVAG